MSCVLLHIYISQLIHRIMPDVSNNQSLYQERGRRQYDDNEALN